MGYQIGDRVICIGPSDGNKSIVGMHGTVCDTFMETKPGVEWDYPVLNGHCCDGTCAEPYGWYVYIDDIKPEEDTSENLSDISLEDLFS